MEHSLKTGLSFGLTSGIITTLGLMVGLNAGTHSRLVVMGGVLTIAIADSFSDALGIHMSEESENKHSTKQIWKSTGATFFAKFFFALSFLVPLLLFELSTAIIVSLGWGFFLLAAFSYYIAREQKKKVWKVITEHLFIAFIVIIAANYAGEWISGTFG